jgi:ADP-ribose pyrophosphatase
MASGNVPPWRKLGTVREYDFTLFKVSEHRVLNPRNQSEQLRAVIDAPDWVNVIGVDTEDRLILVRQFRAGVWSETLELCAGLIEAGEDPLAAGLRELEEESGHLAKAARVLGKFRPNPALQNNWCHIVLAEGCEKRHAGRPDEGEDLHVELHPAASLRDLVRHGRVDHALMIGAFYLWDLARS